MIRTVADLMPGLLAAALFDPFGLVIVRLRPADIHPQQHLGPVLRLGAAGPGMHFEIAVVGVGLAGEEALKLAPRRFRAQLFEGRLGVGDDGRLALGLTHLDQLEGVGDLPLDTAVTADRLVEPGALAQQLLCRGGIIPQARILGLRVQLGETAIGSLPVKDASSAAPTTCRCRRRPPEFRRAWSHSVVVSTP